MCVFPNYLEEDGAGPGGAPVWCNQNSSGGRMRLLSSCVLIDGGYVGSREGPSGVLGTGEQ